MIVRIRMLSAMMQCTAFQDPEPEHIGLPRDGHKLKAIIDSAANPSAETRGEEEMLP